jgi:peptidoglycan/xylan/chitin deacetylase (PgdA/CDA1 family)
LLTGGQGKDFCVAPGSLFDFGDAADANVLPSGGSTRNTPRLKLGTVSYGGTGIYACKQPGTIAITYDDGPYNYTDALLDMFKAYGLKATFCEYNNMVRLMPR